MPVRKLDEIRPGDIVAQDVATPQGVTLLPHGAAITARELRILRTWGVETLRIESPEGACSSTSAAENQQAIEQAEEQITAFFGPSLDNEVMAEILRLAVLQHAAKLTNGGGADA